MEQVLLAEQARSPTPVGGQVAATATESSSDAPQAAEASTSSKAEPSQSAEAARNPPPSLEAEIDQVVQSLGKVGTGLTSFWGGLRAQSTSAYAASMKQLETRAEAAKKDLAPYMDQAKPYMDSAKAEYLKTREELAKIGEQLNQPQTNSTTATTTNANPDGDDNSTDAARAAADVTPTPSFYGEVMTPADLGSGPSPPVVNVDFNPSAFFNKISSQISNNLNLASLQSNLNKNLSRVAPIASSSSKMAEAYLHKGEEYIKHAGSDLEKFLNQAVRIVPGEAAAATAITESGSPAHQQQHKGKTNSNSELLQLAGRKEQLLHRLATNHTIFLLDPAQPLDSSSASTLSGQTHEDTKETFHAFLHDVETHGGFSGAFWTERIHATLADPKNGPLKTTRDALVPEKISSDTFWARYFFRVSQIEADDARRKQVLETAAGQQEQSEDDFSWDNDDEADTPASAAAVEASVEHTPKAQAKSQSQTARRPSSESEQGTSTSSYDVVSQPSASGPSSDSEAAKKAQAAAAAKPQQQNQVQQQEEDEDSDWE